MYKAKKMQPSVYKKRLYELLKNRDDDLPYCCDVNEQHVLDALTEVEKYDDIDEDLTKWLEQWMVFNHALNEFEPQEYINQVAKIYVAIKAILARAIKPLEID